MIFFLIDKTNFLAFCNQGLYRYQVTDTPALFRLGCFSKWSAIALEKGGKTCQATREKLQASLKKITKAF
jgi:hypothetical protein